MVVRKTIHHGSLRPIVFLARTACYHKSVTSSPETDFIVVGAGIAGLRASVELASAGRVLCLAKREVTESNTQYAQGGIAAALSDDDEVSLHLEDTLKAGDGLVNEEAARFGRRRSAPNRGADGMGHRV